MLRCAIVAVVFVSVAPRGARADDTEVGRFYTGAGVGAAVFAGPTVLGDRSWQDRVGWAVGAYARLSTVMQIVDLQLEYHHDRLDTRADDAPVTVRRHSVSQSTNLHPLFLRMLGNNRLWYILGSWYLQVGLSLELTALESPLLGIDRDDKALGIHVGTGLDFPLDDPNDGGAFWLGVLWRYAFIGMNPRIGAHEDLDTHFVLLAVSYRSNDLSFGRVPRPPELPFRQ